MVASADMFYITIDYKACFTLMKQTQMQKQKQKQKQRNVTISRSKQLRV